MYTYIHIHTCVRLCTSPYVYIVVRVAASLLALLEYVHIHVSVSVLNCLVSPSLDVRNVIMSRSALLPSVWEYLWISLSLSLSLSLSFSPRPPPCLLT